MRKALCQASLSNALVAAAGDAGEQRPRMLQGSRDSGDMLCSVSQHRLEGTEQEWTPPQGRRQFGVGSPALPSALKTFSNGHGEEDRSCSLNVP